MPLTAKELSAIEDQLNLEQILVKKYRLYAGTCADQQLKIKCEQIAAQHQDHYRSLLAQLN